MRTPLADMELLSAQRREQQREAAPACRTGRRLDAAIEANLTELGYGG